MKITDAFLGEHAVFYRQFDEVDDMLDRADLNSLKHAAAVIAGALESHAQLEDALLFGPLARAAADGADIFALMEEEHTVIAKLLGEIATARDAARAAELLTDMIAAARDHFAKEENVAFPRAERLLDAGELHRLGAAWAQARNVVLESPA